MKMQSRKIQNKIIPNRKRQNRNKYGIHSLAVTVTLILLIMTASLLVLQWIARIEEGECFERLYEETGSLARSFERNAQGDTEKMSMMAALAAKYEDLGDPALWEQLSSSTMSQGVASLSILLPDETLLSAEGRRDGASNGVSFEQAAALGAHISDREENGEGEPVLRSYMPILDREEIRGILICDIDLAALSEFMRDSAYGGDGALYIIDGSSGEFLVDTWHLELGNIWEMGERDMASGYDHEQLKQGVSSRESNYVVFVSETTGEYLYFYYEPLDINEWCIAISVPEEVVFASVREIRSVFLYFVIFEIVSFFVYFLWILRNSRHEAKEKQNQLDSVHYIYDIEKLLFNAHEKKENLNQALEKIGYIISAQVVAFWLKGGKDDVLYLWRESGEIPRASDWTSGRLVRALRGYFSRGYAEFEAKSPNELKAVLPDVQAAGIQNLFAIPVRDMDGTLCGILLSCNQDNCRLSAFALKSVSFSFRMFCHNLLLYNTLKEQSEKDSLTELKNRNRYELDLKKISRVVHHSLTCVYIDVNGLHELNNTKGHEAGDHMLRTVAAQLRTRFGERYTYRIGGDEFVVFLPDVREGEAEKICGEMVDDMNARQIHISVGISRRTGDFLTTELIKEAERRMYEDKQEYYKHDARGARQRMRHQR